MNFENWIPIIYNLKTNTKKKKMLSPLPPPKPPSSPSILTQSRPESTTSRVRSSTLLTPRRTFGDASASPCSSNFPLLHHQWQIVKSSRFKSRNGATSSCWSESFRFRFTPMHWLASPSSTRFTLIRFFLSIIQSFPASIPSRISLKVWKMLPSMLRTARNGL